MSNIKLKLETFVEELSQNNVVKVTQHHNTKGRIGYEVTKDFKIIMDNTHVVSCLVLYDEDILVVFADRTYRYTQDVTKFKIFTEYKF